MLLPSKWLFNGSIIGVNWLGVADFGFEFVAGFPVPAVDDGGRVA
jgi:hypothetical protein